MDSRRTVLIIMLLVLSFFMYQQWLLKDPSNTPGFQAQEAPQNSLNSQSDSLSYPKDTDSVPYAEDDLDLSQQTPQHTDYQESITVTTDNFELTIALRGGDIIHSKLLKHAEELNEEPRYEILYQEPNAVHIAESGLSGRDGFDAQAQRPTYHTTKKEFVLQGDSLTVPLTYTDNKGNTVTKSFIFKKDDYSIIVNHSVTNNSNDELRMAQYGRLTQTTTEGGKRMFMPTYRGAAYSSQKEKYKKYSFKDVRKKDLDQSTEAGWIAMLEHYFVTAWIPNQEQKNHIRTSYSAANENARISYVGPITAIAPGTTEEFKSTIYMGPKDQGALKALAKHLDLTVDYGFLWWLAQPIHWLIAFLFGFVKNYGVAIILVTVIIKGLLYPLTKAQYTSMAKMRKLQPRMKQLKENYGDDKQKMQQAMMQMYKDEKVNPLGGCLPMLLQLPIFLSLYWVLLESPEIRHADFALWITDLSSRDPYFILPVLMGISMFLMQRLQPMTMTDPMQQKMMQFMPLMFVGFFMFFPSGLVLYWLVSNLITIVQMLIIYKHIDKMEAQK